MRILSCEALNFSSYDVVHFNFEQGLTLIYGKTGSGKSTIPDLPCWIMFGVTTKDGSADDVRSWKNLGERTIGALTIELGNAEIITITRIRGKQNDLYWLDGDIKHRGKDISETQRLLEKRLGFTADVYLSAAYYCEFSPSATFYTAPAKSRRALFENLAPLELPIMLAEKTASAKKSTKAALEGLHKDFERYRGMQSQISRTKDSTESRSERWDVEHAERIDNLRQRHKDFEKEKDQKIKTFETKSYTWEKNKADQTDSILAQIEEIEPNIDVNSYHAKALINLRMEAQALGKQTCKTCGGPSAGKEYKDLTKKIEICMKAANDNDILLAEFTRHKDQLARLQDTENPYEDDMRRTKTSINHYAEQLAVASKEPNPYEEQLVQLKAELSEVSIQLEQTTKEINQLDSKLSSLSQLYDLSYTLRGELLKRAVSEIEAATNGYMEKYFDAEIRVSFELEGSDTLKVGITKNGYSCVYKQLSKGQRQLLKLCFAVSIMESSANKVGMKFANLMFDESLDGLDSDLKLKSYDLFQELSTRHDSIAIIDHDPGFQNLFANKWHITMTDDASQIEVEHG